MSMLFKDWKGVYDALFTGAVNCSNSFVANFQIHFYGTLNSTHQSKLLSWPHFNFSSANKPPVPLNTLALRTGFFNSASLARTAN